MNHPPASRLPAGHKESTAMLDLAYIATGAAFLFVCVLYAFACDRL
jgi:hypothetical protein